MSYFIAVRKDTKDILEMGGRSPDLIGPVLAGFRAALCTNYRVTDDNLSVLVLDNNDASVARLRDGDEKSLLWSGSNLVGVDFSQEDKKRILKVTASKSTILADYTDTTTITVELWKADNTGIATGVTTTADMPIQTPDGIRKVRVNLVSGTASRIFKTAKAGTWKFPAVTKRFGQVRVGASVTVEAVGIFADL